MKGFVFLTVSVLFITLLLGNTVNAEFSKENATRWLNASIVWSQSQVPIEDLSFATMVLKSNIGLNALNSKKDAQTGCFPLGNCNAKDTASATLALKVMNQNIDKQLEYLRNSLKAGSFNKQEWNIQVVTNEAGNCRVKYEGNQNGASFNFGDNGNLIGKDNSWINFNELNDFNFDKAIEEINVECGFNTVPRISIIKIIENNFYIIEEKSLKNANFKLENGCYAVNSNSIACDKDSSFYVSWILSKLNNEITTENYLTSNVNNDLEYAILAYIDNTKTSSLISRQKEDGSFNTKVYETSFAINTLKRSNVNTNELNKAKLWVEGQQEQRTGRIGTGIKDTAVALYLIYGEEISLVGDGIDEGVSCVFSGCQQGYLCNPVTGLCEIETQQQTCNQNLICEINLNEDSVNCFSDCYCGDRICDSKENSLSCSQDCKVEEKSVCGNGDCEIGENEVSCALDCRGGIGDGERRDEDKCGNKICDSDFGEDDFTCPKDCEEEKKPSLWWLWLIIILLVIGAVIFFVLTRLKKGKGGLGETPSYLRTRMPPSQAEEKVYRTPPVRPSVRNEALEKELDESIKEAQELLKKKK